MPEFGAEPALEKVVAWVQPIRAGAIRYIKPYLCTALTRFCLVKADRMVIKRGEYTARPPGSIWKYPLDKILFLHPRCL